MSLKYRLPEVLGGGEVEAANDEPGYPKVGFDLPGVTGRLWLDRGDVTEVKAPLPEEPPNGSVVIADGDAFLRVDHGDEARWWRTGSLGGQSWTRICKADPNPRLLVEAPEPVTLPWVAICQTDTESLRIDGADSDGHVPVIIPGVGTVYLNSANARTGARALWTAADQAEAQS